MKRRFRIKRHKGDPVKVQISVTGKLRKGWKLTKKLLDEMIRRKAETSAGKWDPKTQSVKGAREGKDPKGLKLTITSWTNPGRQKAGDRRSRNYGSQADRWGSLWQIIARGRLRTRG